MGYQPSVQVRKDLTGVVMTEWVDGLEPDNPSAEHSFGWNRKGDGPIDNVRQKGLLLDIAKAEHLNEGSWSTVE